MFKKTIAYEDFSGNKREETFYFNFGKHELLDLEFRTPGGIEEYMKKVIETQDGQKLADMFKWLIDESYGVKSLDGRSFIKGPEVLNNFKYTPAYEILYFELATNSTAAAEFINGVFPKEAVEEAKRQKEMAEKAGLKPEQLTGGSNVVPMQQPVAPQVAPVVQPVQPQSFIPPVEGQIITPANPLQ